MKKVTVFVGGIRCVLNSDAPEEYTRYIANKADHLVKSVKQANQALSTDKTAVLALINAIDKLESMEGKNSASRQADLKEQYRTETLEAQLASARRAVREMQTALEAYQARERLMEAGLEVLQAENQKFDAGQDPEVSQRTLALVQPGPDQLSLGEIRGGSAEAIS